MTDGTIPHGMSQKVMSIMELPESTISEDTQHTLNSYSVRKGLCLSNSEHLGSADRTRTLGSRFAVLHGYALGIFHFSLCLVFNAVCLHLITPYDIKINYSTS